MFSYRAAVFIKLLEITMLIIVGSANSLADSTLGHEIKPALGNPITHDIDTIVSPDGSGLPVGSGTVTAGRDLYQTQCAACHGTDGQQPGNALVGGIGSLAGQRPLKTVGSYWPYASTLFDYIARAMPYNQQKTLSADEVYAVTAYVLRLNGILDDDAVLNEENLTRVKMPNQSGFIELIE